MFYIIATVFTIVVISLHLCNVMIKSNFTNFFCSGQVPSDVVPHLCGVTFYTFKKKLGGFRPIVVGKVLHRLSFKCILSPFQLGVRVSAGCKAIVHLVSSIQGDNSFSPHCKWVLRVDFLKVFNSIDCSVMFGEIYSWIPSMAAWMECCYGSRPLLHLGRDIILSCWGVQQGDPSGSPGFCFSSSSCYREN